MSHAAVTAGTGWMLARQIGSGVSASSARDAHRRPVGEHHHEQAVEVARLEVAHHALGVGAVLDRRRDLDVGDVPERGGDLGGVRRLALGDAREHVVVEALHDPQQADPRPDPGVARGRLLRLGLGHVADRWP